ncbi:MAG TPA: aminoacyl-tRNA hydrolase [Candidatus Moranbacteria bacterium]|nr:aminoacyl-tRNA hydrolase [Candidatus Moranbacteria bacterium]
MKLIIGLGNPGEKYEKTRHNAGFIALDEIRRLWEFPEFKENSRFSAQLSEGVRGGEKILLVKPQTFMNRSGHSVKALVDFYKVPLENIVVIHDDLDIAAGEMKISPDSSSGGHNGAKSLIAQLGTQNFQRIRLGIEGSEKKKERSIPGEVFVLENFSATELARLKKLSGEIAARPF